jgi:hypothetical protein
MNKVIYWDYAFWIGMYSSIFFTIGIIYGKILEKIMPKFKKNKNKVLVFIEIYTQIFLLTIGIYIMREYVSHFIKKFVNIKKNPDKFSTLILATFTISQQPSLYNKIIYEFNFLKYDNDYNINSNKKNDYNVNKNNDLVYDKNKKL